MRRGAKLGLGIWSLTAAWLGCNAILGNESAEYVRPDAGPVPTVTVTAPPPPQGALDGGDATPPCSVDLAIDPKNCGACGHDCLGGACELGECQPLVIARDAFGPSAVAVDETHAYWINGHTGDLMRIALVNDGGAPERVFDGPADTGAGAPIGDNLALRDAYVYFTLSSPSPGVFRCPKTGCAVSGPELVIGSLTAARMLTITEGGTLVVAEPNAPGRIGRCTLPACGDLAFVASDTLPVSATTANGVAYWTTIANGVRSNGLPDGGVRTVTSSIYCSQIAIRGSDLLYACSGQGVWTVPGDGGTPRRFYAKPSQATSFAFDELHVYSTASEGILRCPLDGGCGDAGVFLARSTDSPTSLTLDDASVVFVARGFGDAGHVLRLAK